MRRTVVRSLVWDLETETGKIGGYMEQVKKLCNFMSSNIAVFIIIFSVIAFFCPGGFAWATNYTTIFLGVAMFGMGLKSCLRDVCYSIR